MRSKLRILVCAALCVALGAGAAAGVSITGVDGSTKSLGDIDDIVEFTTGTRTINQESFLKVYKNSDTNGFGIIAVKGDGAGNLEQTKTLNLSATGERTNTGAHPAVGTKRNSDGSIFLMVQIEAHV